MRRGSLGFGPEFTELHSPADLPRLTSLTDFGAYRFGVLSAPMGASIPCPEAWVGECLAREGAPVGQALGTAHSGAGRQPPRAGCCSRPSTSFPHTRPPTSWNLEGLQALGPLATYISSSLWMQVQEVGWCPGAGNGN